jgi:hypothetical protein
MNRAKVITAAACFLLEAVIALFVGCGVNERTYLPTNEVAVVTSPLVVDTSEVIFAMGRTSSFEPLGGQGEIAAGPPREAQMTFREVAEGDWWVEFLGYASFTFTSPNPSGFPSSALCLQERGGTEFAVVSGRRAVARITAVPVTAACQHIAVDRAVAESDYQADASQQWYGSPDGANVITLFVDNWLPGSVIEVDVNTGTSQAPFGLFGALPDTGSGGTWPDADSWNINTLTLITDANGDALCGLVVKPGESPTVWEITVNNGIETASVWVRVAGTQPPVVDCVPANCDDGIACTQDTCNQDTKTCSWVANDAACDDSNPCTTDVCNLTTGCANTSLADDTVCGDGLLCLSGACVPGARFEAIDLTTGWASNEGTFNRNHAELRCGDDGRGYQVYPGLSFDLSAWPTGTPIVSAVVHLYQVRIDGDSPYLLASMNEVVAEHVRYTNMWEADEVSAISETIGQRLVSSSSDLGWKTVMVTEAVTYELAAGMSQVQFRLLFVPAMSDGDAAIDWAVFASDNAPSPNEYQRPYIMLYGQ